MRRTSSSGPGHLADENRFFVAGASSMTTPADRTEQFPRIRGASPPLGGGGGRREPTRFTAPTYTPFAMAGRAAGCTVRLASCSPRVLRFLVRVPADRRR